MPHKPRSSSEPEGIFLSWHPLSLLLRIPRMAISLARRARRAEVRAQAHAVLSEHDSARQRPGRLPDRPS